MNEPSDVRLLDPDEFWKIIEKAISPTDPPHLQIESLRSELARLPLQRIISFENAFRHYVNQAYTWDLWGAAYVVHGGCSDDGFEYFRRWLVARGRDVYERSLVDPDHLASIEGQLGPDGVWEFEDIYYVAVDVFEAMGGEGDVRDQAEPEAGLDGRKPSGVPFTADETHLSQRYPRLWERFGADPLG